MNSLQAVIVPSSRITSSLQSVVNLVQANGTYPVILCSQKSSAHIVARDLAKAGVDGVAIDVPSHYTHSLLTEFATNTFPLAVYAREKVDLALKRNIGLLYSRLVGFEKVLFLDDDIIGLDPSLVFSAGKALESHAAAGYKFTNFPDNSVIRHAQRLSGVEPGVSVSGGALAVDVSKTTSFFPNLYNEDWLFMFDLAPIGGLGDALTQKPYDPFLHPLRAVSEEFGDLIAEGLKASPSQMYMYSSDLDWRRIIAARRDLIFGIQSVLQKQPSEMAGRACVALGYSLAQLENIRPADCHTYIKLWRADVGEWRNNLRQLPSGLNTKDALRLLQLTGIESNCVPQYQVAFASAALAM